MKVIPAVDVMRGKVVRLSRGDSDTAKTYEGLEEPLTVARGWKREGADFLHLIDLDAAMGQGDNRQIISAIIKEVGVPVQVGGGIRSMAIAEELLNTGAQRVIITTLAFEREDMLKELIREFGSVRVMVALDYLNGMVMSRGWKSPTGLSLENAMDKFLNLGTELFLLTSISRDGLLIGPDYKTLTAIVKRFRKGLFIAGGISSLDDLVWLKTIGVEGVVVGKALYERRFSLVEALNIARR